MKLRYMSRGLLVMFAGGDPWKVNADAAYHEDIRAGERDLTGRLVPQKIAAG